MDGTPFTEAIVPAESAPVDLDDAIDALAGIDPADAATAAEAVVDRLARLLDGSPSPDAPEA